MELLAEGDVAHCKGLLALQQAMLEEVALGGDWTLSWSIMPMEDPTEPSPLASMTVSQYATGVAWLKDVQTVQERRNKSVTTPGNDKPKGGGGQKGSWMKLSAAQQEVLKKWKADNPGK